MYDEYPMRASEISVIIPTYNRAHTLERAIRSVWAQKTAPGELIIVNDGSEDRTPELLKKLLPQAPLPTKVLTQENRGVSAARNLAIQQAEGSWVGLLDSDDEWLPDKLNYQVQASEDSPEVLFWHGEEIWIRSGVRVNPHKKHQKFGGWIYEKCLPLCCISPSASLLHKSVFDAVGFFREDFPVCEDYDLWLKICARYQVGFVKEAVLNKYGGHDDQLSRKFFAMDYWRVLALEDIITGKLLNQEQKEVTRQTLIKKCEILIKGYKKHQNFEKYEEVNKILSKFDSL